MIADEAAEADLLGAVIRLPRLMELAYGRAEHTWFYTPIHADLWRILADLWGRGEGLGHHGRFDAWDDWTIRNAWTAAGRDPAELDTLGPKLRDGAPSSIGGALDRLEQVAYRRKLATIGMELREAADAEGTLDELSAKANELTAGLDPAPRTESGVWLHELLAEPDDDDPWVVPGLLRSDWRAVIVAEEGVGKSVLMRQFGLCAAYGVHPLTGRPIEPQRVVIIDSENPRAISRKAFRDMLKRLGIDVNTDSPVVRYAGHPEGLDLRKPRDRAIVERECRINRPSLLVLGPLYKLYSRDPRESDEQAAMAMQRILDRIRTRWHCALLIEHHAPHTESGSARRKIRPFGSSAWLRWPELGIAIEKDPDNNQSVKLDRWRGDRIPNSWPDRLDRSNRLPWVGYWANGMPEDAR